MPNAAFTAGITGKNRCTANGVISAVSPSVSAKILPGVRRSVSGMAASYGGSIVKLVSETVRRWDAQTITDRLETTVGRDLQYIRINGTLVGGLVGVVLHALDAI